MLSRDVICNLTLAAIIVVLLVRRYLQYAESQAAAEAPAAALEEAAAPRRVIPTPTAIPGPAVMRSILGKCKHFKGGNAVEFCGFRSVKQITGAGSHYMGFWGKVSSRCPDRRRCGCKKSARARARPPRRVARCDAQARRRPLPRAPARPPARARASARACARPPSALACLLSLARAPSAGCVRARGAAD